MRNLRYEHGIRMDLEGRLECDRSLLTYYGIIASGHTGVSVLVTLQVMTQERLTRENKSRVSQTRVDWMQLCTRTNRQTDDSHLGQSSVSY